MTAPEVGPKLWRNNLKHAIKFMQQLGNYQVNLDDWETKTECGSVACLGGWIALMPHFRQQGVYSCSSGAPLLRTSDEYGPVAGGSRVAEFIFGPYETASLFAPAGNYVTDYGGGSHKEKAIRRLRHVLAVLELNHPQS